MRNNSNILLIVDSNLLECFVVKAVSRLSELPRSLFRIYMPIGEVMSVIEAESAPFNQE
jgi:hypothetical protein